MGQPIYILSRGRHSFAHFTRWLTSIKQQSYSDYTIIFIDDNSQYTKKQKSLISFALSKHIVVFNQEQWGSVKNGFTYTNQFISLKKGDPIVVSLDQDDRFICNQALARIAQKYQSKKCLFTYGNCLINTPKGIYLASSLSETNSRYPKHIEKTYTFRQHFFRPFHPRTWKHSLFQKIKEQSLKRPDGSWMTTNEDIAFMLPMFEMAGERYEVISHPLVEYNLGMESIKHDARDYSNRFIDELTILKSTPYSPLTEI